MNAIGLAAANLLRIQTREHFIGIILFALFAIQPGLSWAQQVETTAQCDEADDPVGLIYGDNTTVCEISPVGDVDRFEFDCFPGDDVRLNVLSSGGGQQLDPSIEVRDESFNLLGSASCSNIGCSFSLGIDDLPIVGVQTCTIFVEDIANNEFGNYFLGLHRLVPFPDSVRLNYDSSEADTISPATDVDFFEFNATAGTQVRFNVLSTGGGGQLDPTIEVRDPNGTVVIDGLTDSASCTNIGCSFSVELSPGMSGNYSVLLYDLNTNEFGNYQISLWCVVGECDSNGSEPPSPDPAPPVLSFVTPIADEISPATDGDFFTFSATAGTEVRFNVLSTGGGQQLDPTIEIRDPNGTVVIDGTTDGASCTNIGCSFSVNLSPGISGDYSVLLYDLSTNEFGNYQISLWCLVGDCDSDADGVADGPGELLTYGGAGTTDIIDPAVDGDFFIFGGTAGDRVEINVFSSGGGQQLDPTIEIWDPNGNKVIDGPTDGASCNNIGCSYSIQLLPAVSGTYSLLLYDLNTNELGNYQLSLQCLLGDCSNVARMCGDNCTIAPNPGQRDTDGDGFGNVCDADVTNDGVIDFGDLPIFQAAFFCQIGDACYNPDADLTGDGVVDFAELPLIQQSFFDAPGPSCIDPNTP